nr:unnamed protein product [Digitaria exilis]
MKKRGTLPYSGTGTHSVGVAEMPRRTKGKHLQQLAEAEVEASDKSIDKGTGRRQRRGTTHLTKTTPLLPARQRKV